MRDGFLTLLVRFHVRPEVTARDETLLTHSAFVGFYTQVPSQVRREFAANGKCHGAHVAPVGLLTHVAPHVDFQARARGERSLAQATSMLPSFGSVDGHVRLEIPFAIKAPVTRVACVLCLASVPPYVDLEAAVTGE